MEYLPRSFTCCCPFAALIKLQICYFLSLVEFPEVDEGDLPKLRTLEFDSCDSLGNLPLFGGPDQLEEVDFVGL